MEWQPYREARISRKPAAKKLGGRGGEPLLILSRTPPIPYFSRKTLPEVPSQVLACVCVCVLLGFKLRAYTLSVCVCVCVCVTGV
jgi:hypothetical protein